MVDLSDKGSDCEDMGSKTPALSDGTSNQLKTCVDCGTSKTPLWRGGPAGPKSLCNACGIRSRKNRRALLGVNKDDKKSKKIIEMTANHKEENEIEDKLKRKLVGLGKEVVLQRPRITSVFKRRRKLGEEEQAAMLLMALSCGSHFPGGMSPEVEIRLCLCCESRGRNQIVEYQGALHAGTVRTEPHFHRLCHEIDQMMCKFWWQTSSSQDCIDRLSIHKSLEDMCFTNLRNFNLPFLDKQMWRLMGRDNLLIDRQFKNLLLFERYLFESGSNPSFVWRNI